MSRVAIIGAGLSGLIAGAMLRGEVHSIFERQKTIPNNHHALLRFRSQSVGDATGIPFRRVQVMKWVQGCGNPITDAAEYALKVTGKATLRSITGATGRLEERFIAPPNFIERCAANVSAAFEGGCEFTAPEDILSIGGPVISTVPMPTLMRVLDYPGERPAFRNRAGWVIRAELDPLFVDMCATIYFPLLALPYYRASITGCDLIVEGVGMPPSSTDAADMILATLGAFGLGHVARTERWVERLPWEVVTQAYAKILPTDDAARKRFIIWATEEFGVYSLGRFATWRPGLLLDDLVQDVRLIQRMIGGDPSHTYSARK